MRTPERYIEAVSGGNSAIAGREELDDIGRAREGLELSLRTRAGVPAVAVADLDLLVDAGVVSLVGDRAVLTARGRLVANEVAIRLMVAGESRIAATAG